MPYWVTDCTEFSPLEDRLLGWNWDVIAYSIREVRSVFTWHSP